MSDEVKRNPKHMKPGERLEDGPTTEQLKIACIDWFLDRPAKQQILLVMGVAVLAYAIVMAQPFLALPLAAVLNRYAR